MNFKVINQKLNDLLTSLGLTRKQGFYAALSVGVIILALISYVALFTAPQNNTGLEIFSVEADLSSKGNVAQSLEYKGFVKSSLGFQIAFALRGNKEIRSGAYQISKSMNVWEIAKILNGEPTLKWVTIPEGLRKEEIADILAMTLKWSDEDKLKWITALKLASIVQREAAGKDDMSLIAGVLWNRLLKGMKLEVDATVQYARGKTAQGWWTPIKPADKQIQSAYNTYLNKGLPPHPISNPGIDAINATLNSTETKCLYYLHEESGIIHCAETYEEHLSNIEKYLK